MPPKKVVKEKVAKQKEVGGEGEMVAEEGAEPSAPEGEAGAAPAPMRPPSLPPSAPTTSTDAEAAKALQVRDTVL
jgi:hypothetical protein